MSTRQDRIRGMILGHLVGDALGSGYEFGARFTPGRMDPKMIRGVFGHDPGTGTDDTAVMRACAEALLEHGDFRQTAYAHRLIAWKATGPKDIGGQTSRAIATWERTSQPPPVDGEAQGNGALMGCAPLAVLGPDEGPAAARWLSMATHPSNTSVGSCQRYVARLAHALRHSFITYAKPPARVMNWTADGRHIGWCMGSEYLAYQAMGWTDDNPGGITVERALVRVIRMGGDTDTNGAIAGALLGAWWGESAWDALVPQLDPAEHAAAIELADRLTLGFT